MKNKIPEYMIKNTKKLSLNFNRKEQLAYWLDKFEIQRDEICIIGSVPLHLAGIRENEDIDFITTSQVEEKILSKIDDFPECKISKQKIFLGEEVHSHTINKERFEYFGIKNEDLINDEKYHMIVDGFKIFRLEILLSKKLREARPKDLEDVKRIEKSGIIGSCDWDWDLVYSPPYWTIPKDRLLLRVRKKIYYNGLINTIKDYSKSMIRKVGLEKQLEKILLYNEKKHFVKGIQKSRINHSYYKTMVPVPVILSNYFQNGEFLGWDIILECFLLCHDSEFINEDIKENIEDQDSNSVVLSKQGKIIEGRAVLAKKINDMEYWVEVMNLFKENDGNNSKSSTNKKLTYSQIESLNDKFLNIIDKTGLIFYAILWPTAYNIYNEVEKYIGDQVNIIEMKEYDIYHDVSNIIHKIYQSDDRAKPWMLEKKINKIKNLEEHKPIRVLKLWIPDPQLRYVTDREDVVYSKITRDLKTRCRKKFFKQMDEYFYDNLIHFTENYYNNYETANLLSDLEINDRCTKSINYIKAKPNSFDVLLLKNDNIDL
ncbi:hypothetical protein IRB23SM22_20890 [Alkalibacterium sp. s-m-22]